MDPFELVKERALDPFELVKEIEFAPSDLALFQCCHSLTYFRDDFFRWPESSMNKRILVMLGFMNS